MRDIDRAVEDAIWTQEQYEVEKGESAEKSAEICRDAGESVSTKDWFGA